MLDLSVQWLVLAIDASLKAAVLAAAAGLLLVACRVRDSNVRHRVWLGVLLGMPILPLLSQVVPALRLPLPIDSQWLMASVENRPNAIVADSSDDGTEFARSAGLAAKDRVAIGGDELASNTPDGSQRPGSGSASELPPPFDLNAQASDFLPQTDALLGDSAGVLDQPASNDAAFTPAHVDTGEAVADASLPLWPVVLACIWLLGSAVMGLRLIAALWTARRLRLASTRISPVDLREMGVDLACLGRTGRMLSVFECPLAAVPLVLGAIRPRILLPTQWLQWPPEKIQAVLMHEQTHAERGDSAVMLLAEVNCCLYWFHPLAWWLRQHLAALAEQACDDAAIGATGSRTAYARHLLEVAAAASACQGRVAAGVGMARRSNIETRIGVILDAGRPLTRRLSWATALLLLLAIVPAIGLVAALRPAMGGAEEPAADATAAGDAEPDAAPVDDSAEDGEKDAPVGRLQSGPSNSADEHVTFEYAGTVVDTNGQPIAGAAIRLSYWRKAPPPPDAPPLALTDEQGCFRFSRRKSDFADGYGKQSWLYPQIVVSKDGYGFATGAAARFETTGRIPAELSEKARKALEHDDAADASVLTLVPDDVPVRGRIVNTEGRPVSGAKVEVINVWGSDTGTLDAWEAATKERGADYYSARRHVRMLISGNFVNGPQARAIPPTATDADGWFTLKGLGRERIAEVFVSGPGIETTMLHVRSRAGETIELARSASSPEWGFEPTYYPREFTRIVGPSVPVVGRVIDRRTRQPIGGVLIKADRIAGNRIGGSLSAGYIRATTDADGRYRLEGLPLGDNSFLVLPAAGTHYVASGIAVTTAAAAGHVARNVELIKGVLVEGQATDSRTGQRLPGHLEYFAFETNAHLKEAEGFRRAHLRFHYRADEEGRFAIPVLPGPGILTFMADDHHDYPRGVGSDAIEGRRPDANVVVFNTVPSHCIAENHHLLVPLDPDPSAELLTLDLQLHSGATFSGRLVDAEGRVLSDYYVHGQHSFGGWYRNAGERFDVMGYFPEDGRRLMFFHPQSDMVGEHRVTGPPPENLEVALRPAARITGRVVDDEGQPLENLIVGHALDSRPTADDRRKDDDDRGVLITNPDQRPILTDENGRFELRGIFPGIRYSAGVSGPRQVGGQIHTMYLGRIFADIAARPGESKDLGDLRIELPETEEQQLPPNPAEDGTKPTAATPQDDARGARDITPTKPQTEATTVRGRVVDRDGQSVAGANVALIAQQVRPTRGGDLSPSSEVLAEATAASDGRFEMKLSGVSSKTHRYATLIARGGGLGLAWRRFNPDAGEVEELIELPAERSIRGRLIDIEGQPAAGVRLSVASVSKRTQDEMPAEGVGYRDFVRPPQAWPPPVTSDEAGRFAVRGIPPDCGVHLQMEGTDRFAAQDFAVNTGMAEQRGERDATYRPQVRNAAPDEEAVLTLSPAQIFEGVVRFADTGQPAPQAQLTIWASQQETFGSMYSVAGKADAAGRYRIHAQPGVRFGVTAYPPRGTPYLVRQVADIAWKGGATVKQVDIDLPRGVLVRGKIVESATQTPIAGASVQYHPEDRNEFDSDGIITGWQAAELSDDEGRFQIAVLPGPGTLLVHGPGGQFVLQEIGSRELYSRRPGGQRYYAHAIERIEPELDAEALDVAIELERGASIAGRLTDASGEPIEQALMITRLNVSSHSLYWRGFPQEILGGRFEASGLAVGKEYPVHFLDPKRRLGATVVLKAGDPSPTLVLSPCGQARARFVNAAGRPVAGHEPSFYMVVTPGAHRFDSAAMRGGELMADEDFVGNIDRRNYRPNPATDADGWITFPALVPGAQYRIISRDAKQEIISKEFIARSGETTELGEFVVAEDDIVAPVSAVAPKASGTKAVAQTAGNPVADQDMPREVTVTGLVLTPDGKPAAGATVRAAAPLWAMMKPVLAADFQSPMSEVKADRQGRFSIRFPTQPFGDVSRLDERWQTIWKKTVIAASLPGYGPIWVEYEAVESSKPIALRLVEDLPIRGKVIDLEGRPIAGTTVKITGPTAAKGENLTPWLEGIKAGELPWTVHEKAGNDVEPRLVGTPSEVTTQADGTFEIRGLGKERIVGLTFEGENVAHRGAQAVTRTMEPMQRVVSPPPFSGTEPVFGAHFTFTADPARTIEGVVKDAETGKPLSGVAVDSYKLVGYPYSNHRVLHAVTDEHGRFRLVGMPKGAGNELLVVPNDEQPYFMREVDVPNPVGLGPARMEIELHRGVWITGRVTDKATGEPVQGVRMYYLPLRTNEYAQALPEFDEHGNVDGDQMRYQTKADGTYKLVGLPGPAIVGAQSVLKQYRQGVGYAEMKAPKYRESDWLDTYRNPINPSPKWPSAMRQIDPAADAERVPLDFELDPGASVQIRVVDQEGKPVTGLSIDEGLPHEGGAVATVANLGPNESRIVIVRHEQRNVGRVVEIGPEAIRSGEVTVELQACASITARLIDADGAPITGAAIEAVLLPSGDFGKSLPRVTTDIRGSFRYTLVPGCDYQLVVEGSAIDLGAWVEKVSIQPGEDQDLGTLKLGKDRKFRASDAPSSSDDKE